MLKLTGGIGSCSSLDKLMSELMSFGWSAEVASLDIKISNSIHCWCEPSVKITKLCLL